MPRGQSSQTVRFLKEGSDNLNFTLGRLAARGQHPQYFPSIDMVVLIGDIGGTKANFCIQDLDSAVLYSARLRTTSQPSVSALVAAFLAEWVDKAAGEVRALPTRAGTLPASSRPCFPHTRPLCRPTPARSNQPRLLRRVRAGRGRAVGAARPNVRPGRLARRRPGAHRPLRVRGSGGAGSA